MDGEAGRQPWYPTMRIFRQGRFGDWEGFLRECQGTGGRGSGRDRAATTFGGSVRRLHPCADRPGELLDKISILQIKRQRITDKVKLESICRELEELRRTKEAAVASSGLPEGLTTELSQVNERLWEIEDAIRDCEARGDFGPRFIELARSVYRTNDQRTAIKRRINEVLGSDVMEEKLYPRYD